MRDAAMQFDSDSVVVPVGKVLIAERCTEGVWDFETYGAGSVGITQEMLDGDFLISDGVTQCGLRRGPKANPQFFEVKNVGGCPMEVPVTPAVLTGSVR